MATIGIGFRDDNSLAVTYREGERLSWFQNGFGEYLALSGPCVWRCLDGWKIAKERLVTDPENTAQLFKRSMGTNEIFYLDGKLTRQLICQLWWLNNW